MRNLSLQRGNNARGHAGRETVKTTGSRPRLKARLAARSFPSRLRKVLDDLVNRIVAAVHPRRIILFGSAARGQLGPHSDLDVLIVMPDGVHRRRTAWAIEDNLWGLGMPTDLVVVTEGDIRAYGDNHSLVICPALKEGKEIYRAAKAVGARNG
jgi:predicted nucleotidyltransferase